LVAALAVFWRRYMFFTPDNNKKRICIILLFPFIDTDHGDNILNMEKNVKSVKNIF